MKFEKTSLKIEYFVKLLFCVPADTVVVFILAVHIVLPPQMIPPYLKIIPIQFHKIMIIGYHAKDYISHISLGRLDYLSMSFFWNYILYIFLFLILVNRIVAK